MGAHAVQSPEFRRRYFKTQWRHEAAETRLAFFPRKQVGRMKTPMSGRFNLGALCRRQFAQADSASICWNLYRRGASSFASLAPSVSAVSPGRDGANGEWLRANTLPTSLLLSRPGRATR